MADAANSEQGRGVDTSGPARSLPKSMGPERDEASFEKIANVELSLEKTRARTERAAEALRELDAEPHLVEALEQVQEDLTATARRLRQGTYFAVPDAQTRIEAA